MIKFFRKIRQQLLSENKTRKYLLYAVGEIVLVVFGILIALALNNWNEEKKKESEVVALINVIENDLLNNYEHANVILNFYRAQDLTCKKVIHDDLTMDDYMQNDLLSIVTVDWHQFAPVTENLDEFMVQEKSIPKQYAPLLDAIKYLEVRKTYVDEQWKILNAQFPENIKLLTSRFLFSGTDSVSRKKRYDYMLNDPEYKSIVDLFWIHAQVYYDQTSRYRAQTMAVYGIIKLINEGLEKSELDQLFQSKGMLAFLSVDCIANESPNPEYKEIRRGYLLGNLTSQDLKLRITNREGKPIQNLSLKPMQFQASYSEYFGLDGDYNMLVEQLDASGNCIQKYASTKKGYLLVDD